MVVKHKSNSVKQICTEVGKSPRLVHQLGQIGPGMFINTGGYSSTRSCKVLYEHVEKKTQGHAHLFGNGGRRRDW